MVIACASGKGGTGKTLLAVSLALACSSSERIVFVDADVEAPNAHIFLKPDIEEERVVEAFSPRIDEGKCDGCGECADFCYFSALTLVKGKVLFFSELCHSCGGCELVCPRGAVEEGAVEKGKIRKGVARGGIVFWEGRLKIGEPRAPAVITELKKAAKKEFPDTLTIVDCPPGASCALVEAVRDADFCILVTEPTPFGLSDLKAAFQAIQELGIPCGVVINKAGIGGGGILGFCEEKGIPILGEIPYRRSIAEKYARGLTLVDGEDNLKREVLAIYQALRRVASKGAES